MDGKKYLPAHSIPEIGEFKAQGSLRGPDRIGFTFSEANHDIVYDNSVIMASGHKPTGLIAPAFRGRMADSRKRYP